MAAQYKNLSPEVAVRLQNGAVGVLPTDTLYGVVANAFLPDAVERVYRLKGRDADKPCIILVPDIETIGEFGVPVVELAAIKRYWPGPLSVIFNHLDQKYGYLQRLQKLPPFRVPADEQLRDFLRQSGPLIAPSANMQGQPPAETIEQAQEIFAEQVDFYVDGGQKKGEPSTLVQLTADNQLMLLRQGVLKL